MDSCVGNITNSIIDKVLHQIKKKKTKEKVMINIIEPFIKDFASKYYVYFLFIFIALLIIILLQIATLTLFIVAKSSN
jgi:hypothetical protein